MARSRKSPRPRRRPAVASRRSASLRSGGPAGPSRASPRTLPLSRGEAELKRLLAECRVTFYRASGPGGQHRNKTETAVRLYHLPSGITVICAETRSQHRNRVLALARLRDRLRALARRRKPRKKTRVPPGVRTADIEAKRRHGRKKTLRRKPATEDE